MPRSLDPKTRKLVLAEIERRFPSAGPERDVQLFRALLGRGAIPSRRMFFEAFLRVEDKRSGQWTPWRLNRPQRLVEATRLRFERKNEPIRIATLKSRQWGMSRYWLAAGIEGVARGTDVPALIIADVKDGAKKHLEAGKRIVSELPYKPGLKRSNRSELVFERPIGGYVDIASAEEDEPGRGRTYRFVHATEPAFWKDAEKKRRSLVQAVPNQPGTTLSWESTANGYNWWHDFWWDCHKGKNSYAGLFFPWYADPAFDFWIAPEAEEVVELKDTLDEEERYLESIGVGYGSLKWRRWAIKNLCFGDIDSFHQEYPARPEEAFLASGRPVFVQEFVMRALDTCCEAPKREDIISIEQGQHETTVKCRRIHNPRGPFHVWKEPENGKRYIIGADVADAVEGDFSVALVIDEETMEDVAEWHGTISPRDFGKLLAALGWLYNCAWVVPEANSFGVSTIEGLRDMGYPKLMRRAVLDSVTHSVSEKLGWYTDVRTKPFLIDEIRQILAAIGEGDGPIIRSAEACREMLTMEVSDSGKYGAASGKHDDRVIARGIAYFTRRKVYEVGLVPEPVRPEPRNASERHWQQFEEECAAAKGEAFFDDDLY